MNKFIAIILSMFLCSVAHAEWRKVTDIKNASIYLNSEVREIYIPGESIAETCATNRRKAMWIKIAYDRYH